MYFKDRKCVKTQGPTAVQFRKFWVSPSLSRPCDLSLTYLLFQVKLKMQRSDPKGPKPALVLYMQRDTEKNAKTNHG